jgi:hypothetical protein
MPLAIQPQSWMKVFSLHSQKHVTLFLGYTSFNWTITIFYRGNLFDTKCPLMCTLNDSPNKQLIIILNQRNEDANIHRNWATEFPKKKSSHNAPKFPTTQTMPGVPRKLSSGSPTPFKTAMLIERGVHDDPRPWLPHTDQSFHDLLELVISSIDALNKR